MISQNKDNIHTCHIYEPKHTHTHTQYPRCQDLTWRKLFPHAIIKSKSLPDDLCLCLKIKI